MESTTLTKLFSTYGKQKPKQNRLFVKKPKVNQLEELSALIKNPLKQNLKKDVLVRAKKQANQLLLPESVHDIATYFKKNKIDIAPILDFNPNYYNQLNKQEHSERVLFYALYIGILQKLPIVDLVVLTESAKLHDIGRNTIEKDLMHGQKGVGVIKFYNLVSNLEGKDYNALLSVVDAHSAYDKNIEGILNKYDINLQEYERVKNLCYILKDAEALDKVRFFNENAINTERMLKSNQLKTKQAKSMVNIAFALNDFYIDQNKPKKK